MDEDSEAQSGQYKLRFYPSCLIQKLRSQQHTAISKLNVAKKAAMGLCLQRELIGGVI